MAFKVLSVFIHKPVSSFDLAKGLQDNTNLSNYTFGELEELYVCFRSVWLVPN